MAQRTAFQSSDLSRHTAAVFEAAEAHPVDITRRDGETFVLTTEREDVTRAELLHLASQIIAVTTDDHGTLAERMSRAFPWILALSDADQTTCSRDLVNAARASLSTGEPHLAIAEMTSWRETALAKAAGLSNEPVEWLSEPVTVERP